MKDETAPKRRYKNKQIHRRMSSVYLFAHLFDGAGVHCSRSNSIGSRQTDRQNASLDRSSTIASFARWELNGCGPRASSATSTIAPAAEAGDALRLRYEHLFGRLTGGYLLSLYLSRSIRLFLCLFVCVSLYLFLGLSISLCFSFASRTSISLAADRPSLRR